MVIRDQEHGHFRETHHSHFLINLPSQSCPADLEIYLSL